MPRLTPYILLLAATTACSAMSRPPSVAKLPVKPTPAVTTPSTAPVATGCD